MRIFKKAKKPPEPKEVWIVGLKEERLASWQFIGLYDNEVDAIAKCSSVNHFVGPFIVNSYMGINETWMGAYYPNRNKIKT
jgi:hypothetical protein